MENQQSENNQTNKKEQKLYWREHNRRRTRRQKLKLAVADFCSRLQVLRYSNLNKKEIAILNYKIQKILHLPYRWTDKDLDRAFTALADLEQKYLKSPYATSSETEINLLDELKKQLTTAELPTETKVKLVFALLKDEVEEWYLQGAEKITPSPQNALLLLTQNLKYNMPKWFHEELLNLLYDNYKGTDFNEFMHTIRTKLQTRRIKENSLKLNTTPPEDEDE
ncbi:MAG: hypothetical protein MJ032_03300 [Acidaminococcaceae bacterium]|nr:hypothetical protein [Acidaminococcaceae bacterium]